MIYLSLISCVMLPLGYLLPKNVLGLSDIHCSSQDNCKDCHTIQGCLWQHSNNNSVSCVSGADTTKNTYSEILVCDNDVGMDNRVLIRNAIAKLHAGDSKSFQFTVQSSPVSLLDFYMLIDLSNSISDDLSNIEMFSQDIADTIGNFSTNYLVGFGTFVDKLTYPYVSDTMLNPELDLCMAAGHSIPFSFNHNVDLTNNTEEFTNGISALDISGNLDDPEGTFDAVSQAVLCKELIGWRDNSIKILFVLTDEILHMAGDGRLAGIMKPSPRECKTTYDPSTDSFTYVDNTKFDYPSPGEIRELLIDNNVIPVFAVTDEHQLYYSQLKSMIEITGAQVINIRSDSSDIITAINFAYESIVSNVGLKYDTGEEEIGIEVIATCPEGTITDEGGASCSNVTVGQQINFQVNVTLHQCTEELQSGSRLILVNIPGYGRFDLEVKGICP